MAMPMCEDIATSRLLNFAVGMLSTPKTSRVGLCAFFSMTRIARRVSPKVRHWLRRASAYASLEAFVMEPAHRDEHSGVRRRFLSAQSCLS